MRQQSISHDQVPVKDGAGVVALQRIAGFDGLRAIAFLLVFASHKAPLAHPDPFGDIGVWMFFALSGFLITRILAGSREAIERGAISLPRALGRFYIRRTARIFPVYYLVLLVALGLSAVVTVDFFWPTARVAYALFLTNVFIGLRDAWIGEFGHLWTLAVEEQFYILLAPLVLMAPRAKTGLICLGFVVAGLAVKIGMESLGASNTEIDVNSVVNFGLLGFGGLVGLNVHRRAPAWLVGGAAQALVGLAFLALPIVFGAWREAWLTWAKISTVLAGLLLLQIYQAPRTGVVAFLEWAPLRLIGRVSYGAYLFHHFIHFSVLEPVIGGVVDMRAPPQLLAMSAELAMTLALAALSWRLLEKPIVERAANITARGPWSPAAALA
jgi:peptidoglycan/LPS O-acetylase OafA/YrhL